MPATATSDTHHCSCLGHLGRYDPGRIVSIACHAAQGGQGNNILCHCRQSFCQNNITNVNDLLPTCKLVKNDLFDQSEYDNGKEIGRGKFAVVYEVRHRKTGTKFAAKHIK